MSTLVEKIKDIEKEISRTQINKATMSHLCSLRAKLAKYRTELLAGPKTGGPQEGTGFDVEKVGDARVALIGFPSVGKSTMLTVLTGTESVAAAYEFTTLTCIPGTIHYRGARIQLLDMPGIIEGAKDGKGRGRQVIGTARTCDLILIVLDAAKPLTHKRIIERELEGFGIRLNQKPPNVVFTQKGKGGVAFRSTHPQTLDDETVKAVCTEYRCVGRGAGGGGRGPGCGWRAQRRVGCCAAGERARARAVTLRPVPRPPVLLPLRSPATVAGSTMRRSRCASPT
jgi:small GTP-binding protein